MEFHQLDEAIYEQARARVEKFAPERAAEIMARHDELYKPQSSTLRRRSPLLCLALRTPHLLPLSRSRRLAGALHVLSRQSIRLEELVPVSAAQRPVLELQSILDMRSVCQENASEDWLDAGLDHLWGSPDMTPTLCLRFREILTVWQAPDVGIPMELRLFTDGSFRAGAQPLTYYGCAWSFCAWLVGDRGTRLIGHASHCAVPRDTPYFLGEEECDALSGELLALAWAYAWALDCGVRYALPVTVCFDCTSAGLGTCGLQHPPRTDSRGNMSGLAAFVVSLRLCLSALVDVVPCHVRSHTGVLENELVDQLAKAASRSPENPCARCLPTWPGLLARHHLHAWAWRLLGTRPDLPTLFALPSEAERLQQSQQPAVPPPTDGQPPVVLDGRLCIHVNFVTVNVLSLLDPVPSRQVLRGPAAAGMRLYGKRDILKQQMEARQVHILGLQETRLQGDVEAPDSDFWILQASATPEGQYGVALWVHKTRPFLWFNDQPLRVQRDGLTVALATPRAMVVDVTTPVFRLVVVVAHAPHDATLQ